MIDKLFCTPIYYCILEPDQKVFDTMLSYAKRKTSSNLHNDAVNYTGDTTGESSIHNHVNFYWLNEQISFHAKEYLKELGSDINSINLYAQKSWIAACNPNNGEIYKHIHKSSTLSVVYYLQLDEESCGGELVFWTNNSIVDDLPIGNDFRRTEYSTQKSMFTPQLNKLIIFPSHIYHQVESYESKKGNPRISISYDLTITSKRDTISNEHLILDPSLWKKI